MAREVGMVLLLPCWLWVDGWMSRQLRTGQRTRLRSVRPLDTSTSIQRSKDT